MPACRAFARLPFNPPPFTQRTGASPMHATNKPDWTLPPLGDNPSTNKEGTTPGSFANPGRVGTPYAFSSPDTPGMPPVSDKTAWDFMPADWEAEIVPAGTSTPASSPCQACGCARVFTDSLNITRRVTPPA